MTVPEGATLWAPLTGGDGTHRVMFMIFDGFGDNGQAMLRYSSSFVLGDHVIGLQEAHVQRGKVDGRPSCGGYLCWETPWVDAKGFPQLTGHHLVCLEPLTVEPSLGCRTCASHGFIRSGVWSDAA